MLSSSSRRPARTQAAQARAELHGVDVVAGAKVERRVQELQRRVRRIGHNRRRAWPSRTPSFSCALSAAQNRHGVEARCYGGTQPCERRAALLWRPPAARTMRDGARCGRRSGIDARVCGARARGGAGRAGAGRGRRELGQHVLGDVLQHGAPEQAALTVALRAPAHAGVSLRPTRSSGSLRPTRIPYLEVLCSSAPGDPSASPARRLRLRRAAQCVHADPASPSPASYAETHMSGASQQAGARPAGVPGCAARPPGSAGGR